MKNVKIKAIEIYHPENSMDNEYYLELFKSQNKDISGLLEAMGRKKRYIINTPDENTLTMGIKASKKVLKKANLAGEDIDMIIFSSQMPEYTFPTQALIVHSSIKGNPNAMCQDTNTNCVGMLVAVDTASRYMLSNPHMNRALVIGSDFISLNCRKDDEMTYPNFGDAACALILEKTDENCGFIDTVYKTCSSEWDMVKFPGCGASKRYNKNIPVESKKLNWTPFNGSFIVKYIEESINTILKRNNLSLSEINSFCFSQYAKSILIKTSEKLNISMDKFIYVGDEFGYTGTSSPFITLYKGIKSGRIKRGDTICFWSIGTNWTTCTMLIKY